MALGGMLPPVIAEVVSEIGKYKAGMGEVKAEMSSLEAAQTKLAAAGKVAAAALAVGIAGVGYESIKMGMAFSQQMELIHTQAGASQAEVDKLKGSVLALAPAVGIGPEELATGLYHIESTGLRGAAAMDVLTQSAKLAKIGMASLDDVTYAMSGVMAIGMSDIHSAADAISFLNATVGMGDMRMSQLTAAIGTGILPAFKTAGLAMVDFSASLATLTDNSVPADEAATRLRMTVALMSAPTLAASDALATIGMTSTQMADDMRKPNGLLVAVEDLKHHLESAGMTAVQQNQVIEHAFGGGRTSGAIMTLLEESDKLKSKYDQLGTAAGRAAATDEAWARQQKEFSQQWSEFVATLQATGVKIGTWLIPKLQETFAWINKNGETVKVLAAIIGGVLVVAIGAWTVALIQAAIANIAATWEIMLIIAAIAALAYGIYELVKHWSTVWNWIKKIALDVWGWLVDAWHWTIKELQTAAMWVKTHVVDPIVHWFEHYLVAPIKFYLAAIVFTFKFVWGFLSVIINDFKRSWMIVWGAISAGLQVAWETVIKPVLGFINTYGIQPVLWAINILKIGWGIAWNWITEQVSKAWAGLKIIWGLIVTYGIDPIKQRIQDLKDIWSWVWDTITDAVSKAWGFIKPILDKIGGAISGVKNAISGIFTGGGGSGPGGAGGNVAHMLGFADGGVVPGPVGAPQLAVVHGGEQILSNAQLSTMGRNRTVPSGGGSGGGGFAGGGGDIVINQRIVMPDGKLLREQQLRYARRAGISPADLLPVSTNGLTG